MAIDPTAAYRLRRQRGVNGTQVWKDDAWVRKCNFQKATGEFALDGVLCLDPEHNFFYGVHNGRRPLDKVTTYTGGANGLVQDKLGAWSAQAAANRATDSNNGLHIEPASSTQVT